ncbi:hypothetical protein SODG_006503 [Sodalis praecaptivus]
MPRRKRVISNRPATEAAGGAENQANMRVPMATPLNNAGSCSA